MNQHPRYIRIEDYHYHLPAERIAQHPLTERDSSKLLVYRNGEIKEDIYRNLAEHIDSETLLVFNNTRVIHARLFFTTATGALVEVFCLEPSGAHYDIQLAMARRESVQWKCLIGRASKWKNKVLTLTDHELCLEAEIIDRTPEAFIVEFRWQPSSLSFSELLERLGKVPIPPYIKRDTEEDDHSRYQTIYAAEEGSVAAPTAGLHFTDHIFQSFEKKNISKTFVTLHVGAGTFKPVTSPVVGEHLMHAEHISVSVQTISTIRNNLSKTIIAVGTTSLRTIESIYWLGVKTLSCPDITLDEMEIGQWEVYDSWSQEVSPDASLNALLHWMHTHDLQHIQCKTRIMIAPGYSLRLASALITNFHQPSSTLLLLIAAILGEDWRRLYQYALEHNYRFLSYGDGMLIYR